MAHSAPKHSISRTSRLLLAVACAVVACSALAPSASAGILVKSAGKCAPQPLEQPFLRWLDPAQYTLLPGGTFESTLPGWTLSGARVASGNETYYVHGKSETKSLSIPSGSNATSAVICVGLGHPTMRFFAKSSGGTALATLKVDVLFELATGQVVTLPIGVASAGAHRSWQPTLPMTVVANLLPLLPGARTPVAFRFTPVGAASWAIDDVYVDPRYR
jgi:hypothetical protein